MLFSSAVGSPACSNHSPENTASEMSSNARASFLGGGRGGVGEEAGSWEGLLQKGYCSSSEHSEAGFALSQVRMPIGSGASLGSRESRPHICGVETMCGQEWLQ